MKPPVVWGTLAAAALAALLATPVPVSAADAGAPPRARTGGPAGMGTDLEAPLLFEELWTRDPQTQPMEQKNLANKDLALKLYGDIAGIRKTYHPSEDYTYTGETKTNWAILVTDPNNRWDLSGNGKVLLKTRNSGYRTTRIVIKTTDGRYYASEEGSGESSAWVIREYILSDLTWRALLMTDKPTNASNQRAPDPNLTPIIPLGRGIPDLTKVEEVGFSDLMPGGWIPSTTRVKSWAVYGKKVPR